MKTKMKHIGSALLLTVFAIALLSALVVGILQMNTEEIQLMRNQIYASQAVAMAEAGLNDAFAEIRADDEWVDGFDDKLFLPPMPSPAVGGSYTVDVDDNLPNLTITSTATTDQGFVARVAADITVGNSGPPYSIRIDELRINDEDDG